MNTNEDEKLSFREALKEGINKKRYLLDRMKPKDELADEVSENDEASENYIYSLIHETADQLINKSI